MWFMRCTRSRVGTSWIWCQKHEASNRSPYRTKYKINGRKHVHAGRLVWSRSESVKRNASGRHRRSVLTGEVARHRTTFAGLVSGDQLVTANNKKQQVVAGPVTNWRGAHAPRTVHVDCARVEIAGRSKGY
jgi:hypothetical protein